MSYDLGRLSSDEFEDLAADIISEIEGCRVEVYKAGQDQGIDGKFRTWGDGKGIIQAKHWVKSTFNALIKQIESEEVIKAKKLNADKYVFFTSQELSHLNKSKIIEAFDGCIGGTENIYGFQDIERFLKANSEVERRHFKLWLSSASVMMSIFNSHILGESDFTLKQIYEESKYYVPLPSHQDALNKLLSKRVLIIKGAPGVGKTTLAKNICLEFVGDGYQLINVDDISKSGGFLNDVGKFIFYFDDFLGRNYCDAVSDKEDSAIIKFMKRVQNSNSSFFVLTSRSNILTRRKSEVEDYSLRKVYKNEYELNINNVSLVDKAKVLRSHMVHSGLKRSFIEYVLYERFYRKIVKHRNYNPRVIEFLFDSDRVRDDNVSPHHYQKYIVDTLNNPSEIWDFCFKKQPYVLRVIMLGISYSGRGVNKFDEEALRYFFQTIKLFDNGVDFSDLFDCLDDCLKSLTGSMISRSINEKSRMVFYDVYNPSINDYIYKKYFFEYDVVAKLLASYDYVNPLQSFGMQYVNHRRTGLRIVNKTIAYIEDFGLDKPDSYLMYLMDLSYKFSAENTAATEKFMLWLKNYDYKSFTPKFITLFFINLDRVERHFSSVINTEEQFDFLMRCIDNCIEFSDVEAIVARAKKVDLDILDRLNRFESKLVPVVENILNDEIESRVENDSILSDLLPHEESDAEDVVYYYAQELIEGLVFSNLVLEVDIHSIVSNVNIESILDNNVEEDSDSRCSRSGRSRSSDDLDDIDDFFDDFELPEN